MTYRPGDVAPWDIDSLTINRGVVNIGDSVLPPAVNVTFVANGAGVLTGAYFYLWTFVTAAGETSPWIGQAVPTTLTANQTTVTVPAGGAGVTARRLYRSKTGGSAPDRAVFFLAEIPGAEATTYADNTADGALGSPPNWTSENRGYLTDGIAAVPIARFADQVTTFGQEAGGPTPSYATTAIGYRAGATMAGGTRNTLVGVYAGELLTNARENTAVGVHAMNATVTGASNTAIGYTAGGTYRPLGNQNVAVGAAALHSNLASAGVTGNGNTAVGFNSMFDAPTGRNRVLALGAFSGRYADADYQLWIDNQDRGSLAASKTDSLIFGQGSTVSMQSQTLAFNAAVRAGGKVTVTQLPAASAALAGHRFTVTDGSVAYTSANVGATVAGGGANVVPVFCNGTAWVIG